MARIRIPDAGGVIVDIGDVAPDGPEAQAIVRHEVGRYKSQQGPQEAAAEPPAAESESTLSKVGGMAREGVKSALMAPVRTFATPKGQEIAEGYAEAVVPSPRTAAATGINMAGSGLGAAGGATLGSLVAPGPGTVAGGVIGEAAGSLGARKLNVFLGLEEAGDPVLGPFDTGDIAATVLPGALKAGGLAVKEGLKRLPGVSNVLHGEGIDQVRAAVEAMKPKEKSGALYDAVTRLNPSINLTNAGQAAKDYITKAATVPQKLRNPTVLAVAEGLDELATATPNTPFQTLHMVQKQIRDYMGEAHGEALGMLKQFDAAIWKDLEARSAQGGGIDVAGSLKMANAAYRKEQAVKELEDIVERGVTDHVQGLGTGRLNAGAMEKAFDKKLRDNELFEGAWTKTDIDDLHATFKELSKISLPSPAKGAQYGSGALANLGALGAVATGNIPAGLALVASSRLMGSLLTTTPGRSLVQQLSRSGNLMTPEGMVIMRTFINEQARGMDMLKGSSSAQAIQPSQILPMDQGAP